MIVEYFRKLSEEYQQISFWEMDNLIFEVKINRSSFDGDYVEGFLPDGGKIVWRDRLLLNFLPDDVRMEVDSTPKEFLKNFLSAAENCIYVEDYLSESWRRFHHEIGGFKKERERIMMLAEEMGYDAHEIPRYDLIFLTLPEKIIAKLYFS